MPPTVSSSTPPSSTSRKMEYKTFTYSFLKNTNGASSRSINSIAYVTREGKVYSTRKDHQPFLKNFQTAALSFFDIEREDIQLISRNDTEIYVQFSPWQRFAQLFCLGGRRCRATAELPEDTGHVRAELRKEEVITPLGIAEEVLLQYPGTNKVYSVSFDLPESPVGHTVVFIGAKGVEVLSRTLAEHGNLCLAPPLPSEAVGDLPVGKKDRLICNLKLRPGYSVADPQSTVPNSSISESAIVDTEIDAEPDAEPQGESGQTDPESLEAGNTTRPYVTSGTIPSLTKEQNLTETITKMLKDNKDYWWDDIHDHFPGVSKNSFRRTWYKIRKSLPKSGKLSRLFMNPRRGKALTIYVGGGDSGEEV